MWQLGQLADWCYRATDLSKLLRKRQYKNFILFSKFFDLYNFKLINFRLFFFEILESNLVICLKYCKFCLIPYFKLQISSFLFSFLISFSKYCGEKRKLLFYIKSFKPLVSEKEKIEEALFFLSNIVTSSFFTFSDRKIFLGTQIWKNLPIGLENLIIFYYKKLSYIMIKHPFNIEDFTIFYNFIGVIKKSLENFFLEKGYIKSLKFLENDKLNTVKRFLSIIPRGKQDMILWQASVIKKWKDIYDFRQANILYGWLATTRSFRFSSLERKFRSIFLADFTLKILRLGRLPDVSLRSLSILPRSLPQSFDILTLAEQYEISFFDFQKKKVFYKVEDELGFLGFFDSRKILQEEEFDVLLSLKNYKSSFSLYFNDFLKVENFIEYARFVRFFQRFGIPEEYLLQIPDPGKIYREPARSAILRKVQLKKQRAEFALRERWEAWKAERQELESKMD